MKRKQFEDEAAIEEMRLERRRQRNRKAAALSRQRMREKMQHLEENVKFLERRNMQLEKHITLLKSVANKEKSKQQQDQQPPQLIKDAQEQQQQQQQQIKQEQPPVSSPTTPASSAPVIVTPRPNPLHFAPPSSSPIQKSVQVTCAFQMMPEPVPFDLKMPPPMPFSNCLIEEFDATDLDFLKETLLDASSLMPSTTLTSESDCSSSNNNNNVSSDSNSNCAATSTATSVAVTTSGGRPHLAIPQCSSNSRDSSSRCATDVPTLVLPDVEFSA